MFSNMRADLLLQRRVVTAPDAFVEIVIWRVPQPVAPSAHEFKYRLAYVVCGECVLRFDNERGKGDHHDLPKIVIPDQPSGTKRCHHKQCLYSIRNCRKHCQVVRAP